VSDKPKLFIGSSTESLPVANVLQEQLQHDAVVNVWNQGIFAPGDIVFDRLAAAVAEFDFAALIFGADDTAVSRGKRYLTARDNVGLELGLFAGQLGRERTFVVVQKTPDWVHLPSDLQGVVTAPFEWPEDVPFSDYQKLHAALGPVSQSLRSAMLKRGASLDMLQALSAGMVFIGLCLQERTYSILELSHEFMKFQQVTQRVRSDDAAEYAAKAAKYACQCLQALGIAQPIGGDEYYLTPVGKEVVKSGKLQRRFPTAYSTYDAVKHKGA